MPRSSGPLSGGCGASDPDGSAHAASAGSASVTDVTRLVPQKEAMIAAASKTVSALTLLVLLGMGAVGCAGEPASNGGDSQTSSTEEKSEAPEPVDLTGEWKQTNSNDPESFQTATITADTIEVFWNAPDSKSLYWAGTVEVPEDGSTSFAWDSVNDKTKTDSAVLASGDDTKTFAFENGELSYDVTALGTTMTVRLSQE